MAERSSPLGRRLKAQRRLLGLTLADVGQRLGLANGNFVGMVERGERAPSDDRLLVLADVLGLPSRDLLALKYEGDARSQVGQLLAPVPATLPRLRRFMLGTCATEANLRTEFERGARTTLERLVWRGLLHHVVLPSLDADSLAPRRLQDHVAAWQRRLRRDPEAPLDDGFFEQHADLFVPWARTRFREWGLDLETTTLRIEHRPGDTTLVSFGPVTPAAAAPSAGDPRSALVGALRGLGLLDEDIDEIVTLVELKSRRRAREGATS